MAALAVAANNGENKKINNDKIKQKRLLEFFFRTYLENYIQTFKSDNKNNKNSKNSKHNNKNNNKNKTKNSFRVRTNNINPKDLNDNFMNILLKIQDIYSSATIPDLFTKLL